MRAGHPHDRVDGVGGEGAAEAGAAGHRKPALAVRRALDRHDDDALQVLVHCQESCHGADTLHG